MRVTPSTPGSWQRNRTRALSLVLLLSLAAWALQLVSNDRATIEPSICHEPTKQARTLDSKSHDWRTEPNAFIAHAGGGIKGITYTNSREAITSSIAKGYRLIELDLLVSSDGYIVAAHDWQTFRQRTGREPRPDNEQALSLADFRARKIDGLFTPVDEQAIRDLLLQHPDMVLVTDKIDDFQKLAHAFPFPDRMVVEVFSPKSFLAARREGIQHPMLSVANLEMSYDFISSNAVRHVAVSTSELLRCPGAAAKLVESGVAVFSFTTNEAELMAKYLQSHVSAFYTDFWDVSAGRCSAESCTGDARASTSGGHVK